MRAVLEDALRTHRGVEPARRRLRREVAEWLASDDTSWPFSFVNVCRGLAIDPERLRADVHGIDRVAA